MVRFAHGTGWEADDCQGNGACRGNAAGLFLYQPYDHIFHPSEDAYGAQDYPGIRQSDAPTLAAALRYTFNDPLGDNGNALHPFAEIGGWTAPRETLTLTRTYQSGVGLATGQGNMSATSWDEYVRSGLIWDVDKTNRLTGFGEVGQQNLAFGGYSETLSQSNPFPATVDSGVMRFGVARLGTSWTTDLQPIIYAPWSLTLAGAAARSFGMESGLHVSEVGLANMTPTNSDATWAEYGAQLDAKLTDRITASLGLTGTSGAHPIGTVLHGDAGLSYRF